MPATPAWPPRSAQRLFDQPDPEVARDGRHLLELAERPALVRVDDEGRARSRAADRLEPRPILVIMAELDLDQRPIALARGNPRGFGGRLQRDRVGGDDLAQRGETGDPGGVAAALLRLEIPKRRIERVAPLRSGSTEAICDRALGIESP